MPILKLLPFYKYYLWGGNKLKTEYNKSYEGDILAETWELSCHEEGESVIANGPYHGKKLSQYIKENQPDAPGNNAKRFDMFPVMVKLIDARQDLAVQVHPDDGYALSHEGQYGKTEMWYVLDCKKDAAIYYGFSKEMTRKELWERIKGNRLTEVLNRIKVRPGDVFFIPAGMIHAIGAGITVAEVQQNSNVTYRVYDFDRIDSDGSLRELHIEKVLDTITLTPPSHKTDFGNHLACCKYFTVDELKVSKGFAGTVCRDSFHHILIVEGEGVVQALDEESCAFVKGDSLFLPAGTGEYQILGHCTALLTTIPFPAQCNI